MNRKINNQLKGRIRDKVKQVLLIDGIPEVLYRIIEKPTIHIIIGNVTHNAGDMPKALVDELKKIPTIKIIETKRTSKKFYPLTIPSIGHRTTIRAINGNTHITIGAIDEQQLAERVEIIKEYLESKNIYSAQRCHWVCSIDKHEEKKVIDSSGCSCWNDAGLKVRGATCFNLNSDQCKFCYMGTRYTRPVLSKAKPEMKIQMGV